MSKRIGVIDGDIDLLATIEWMPRSGETPAAAAFISMGRADRPAFGAFREVRP